MSKVFFLALIVYVISACTMLSSQEYRRIFEEKYDISKDSAKAYSTQLSNSINGSEKVFGLASKAYILGKEGDYVEAYKHINLSLDALAKIKNSKVRAEEKLHILYFQVHLLLAEHKMEEANAVIGDGVLQSKFLKNALMQIKFDDLVGRSYSLSGLDHKAIKQGKTTIAKIEAFKSKLSRSTYEASMFKYQLNLANRAMTCYWRDSVKNKSYLDSTHLYVNNIRQFVSDHKINLNLSKRRRLLNLDADISYLKKDYLDAIDNYEATIAIALALHLNKRVYQMRFRVAECYFLLGEYNKALDIFDGINTLDLERYDLLKNGIIINYYYALIYSELGDPSKALFHTNIYNTELDDYYKKMSDLKVNTFESNELRAKKEILEELKFQKESNTTLSFYLYVSLIILVCGFLSALIFYNFQKRKFKHKLDKLNLYIESLQNTEQKPATKKVAEAKANSILTQLKNIESEHLYTDVNYSLNKVAKRIGSNSAYVSQVVNEYWGKSFVRYTNELRINHILLKLKEDELYQKFTLVAIAESAGYKSLSSFNKHFKAITGVSPKQYLLHLKQNKSS